MNAFRSLPARRGAKAAFAVGVMIWASVAALASDPTDTQPATQPGSAPASASAPGASLPASTSTSTGTTTTQGADKKKDRYLAVINGVVHTLAGPTLEGATVLSRNGKIAAIGRRLPLPQDCEVVDAAGMHVYPGLIALGATGIHSGANPEDSTDVFSLSMNMALAAGITTAVAGDSAAKLTWGTVEDLLLRRNLWFNVRYSTRLPSARAELRADLSRVYNYLRELRAYEENKERDKDAKPPEKEWLRGKYEDYRKLLTGETFAVATADRTYELLALADLAQTFGFDLVIRGAYEGWTVAPQLGRAGIRAIVTPRRTQPPDERLNRPNGARIENARILNDHGVTVGVVPSQTGLATWGVGGRDLMHLNLEAAFAVRGGMSNDAAIRTVTIDAARVLGIEDRVGSLEVGKDADLIVCSGDVLHYMTQVHYSVVNGHLAYDKSKDSFFKHIRPSGKPEIPTFENDSWPRRLEWPSEDPSRPAAASQSTTAPSTQP